MRIYHQIIFIIGTMLITIAGIAQTTDRVRVDGVISFISSQNCYVKFSSTEGLNIGDTLYQGAKSDSTGVVVLRYISTHSVAGEQLTAGKYTLAINQTLIGFARVKEAPKTDWGSTKQNSSLLSFVPAAVKSAPAAPDAFKISGRLSEQLASDFSKEKELEVQQFRTMLNFTAENLFIPKLSLTNYLMFAYREDDWQKVKTNPFDFIRVYDLALSYAVDSATKVWAGRHLNYRMANAGAIDGIQLESSYKSYIGGVVIGSRPSFANYGYDLKYFQYGGYIGRIDKYQDSREMENIFAFFNQTYKSKTDRRYAYFQHSNNLISNSYLFVSSEIDLYKQEAGAAKNSLTLTSLYTSFRYTPGRVVSFNLTYDARRNVIYYETYRTFVENLLNNELRQGLRANVYIRPLDRLNFGLNTGYRYQHSDNKPTRDYGSTVYYSGIPYLTVDFNGAATYLTGNYLKGYNWSAELNKIVERFYISAGYRQNNFSYLTSSYSYTQKSMYSYVSYSLSRLLTIAVNYEGIFDTGGKSNRIFIDITTRF